MKNRVLAAALVASFSGAAFADATSHKLFVGTFDGADQLKQFIKTGESMTRAETTVIPCEAGTRFGAAYMLEIPQALQRSSRRHTFTETWSYPESDGHNAAVVSREIEGSFKRQRSNPLFSGSVVDEGVDENAEFHLAVTKDGETYLDHTFQVMGCSADTLQALNSALNAEDPDELLCTMEDTVGTRIKKRVCRTRAEIELNRDMMEQELRNSSS